MLKDVRTSLQPDAIDRHVGRFTPDAHSPWLLAATPTPSSLADTSDDAPSGDLSLIAAHFAGLLGADGWAATFVTAAGATICLARAELHDDQVDAVIRLTMQTHAASVRPSGVPVWMEAVGASRPASALVLPPCRASDGTCAVVTLVYADRNDEERREIDRLGVIHWPPVAAYLRLWLAVRVERHRADGIEAGLNLVAIGVVLLSDEGRIVFANDAARVLIDGHDGIREHRGQLQATSRSDMAPLSNAIGYALAGPDMTGPAHHAPLLTLNRREGPPLVASFIAAPRRVGQAGENGALGFFIDPGLDIRQLAEPVCKLFHLSRVETELACLLASGRTLASAAQSLHVKIDTARGYLKHIFLKTGSNRQVDLVRLIFSNLIRAHDRPSFDAGP